MAKKKDKVKQTIEPCRFNLPSSDQNELLGWFVRTFEENVFYTYDQACALLVRDGWMLRCYPELGHCALPMVVYAYKVFNNINKWLNIDRKRKGSGVPTLRDSQYSYYAASLRWHREPVAIPAQPTVSLLRQPAGNFVYLNDGNRRYSLFEYTVGFVRMPWIRAITRTRKRVSKHELMHTCGLPDGWYNYGEHLEEIEKPEEIEKSEETQESTDATPVELIETLTVRVTSLEEEVSFLKSALMELTALEGEYVEEDDDDDFDEDE